MFGFGGRAPLILKIYATEAERCMLYTTVTEMLEKELFMCFGYNDVRGVGTGLAKETLRKICENKCGRLVRIGIPFPNELLLCTASTHVYAIL